MPPASALAANPRAALLLLRALATRGVGHLVVCPGSRSAPLAVAAALLERSGVRVHTAIDERSAAFFALGLGRALGWPAAVITTSGTAVANLLPAAVEADHGTIPLLLLTADRPARLKGCGANQTVNQERFLLPSCRWCAQGDPGGLARMGADALEAMAARAVAAARGDGRNTPAGPVHLNLAFDEPLHAGGAELLALAAELEQEQQGEQPGGRATPPSPGVPPAASAPRAHGGTATAAPLDPDLPGVVVAGPWRGAAARWESHLEAVRRWQRRTGWPLLADALSGLRGQPGLDVVAGYDLLLEEPGPELQAPQVLRLGPLPASRRLERWLAGLPGPQLLVSEGDPRPLDPLGVVGTQRSEGLAHWLWEALPPLEGPGQEPSAAALEAARRWRQAEARLQAWLEEALEPTAPAAEAGEPWLARRLSRLLPPGLPLMLANSSPVRDWETFADPAAPPRPVVAFRGASGIDGTLSLACGLAEALGQVVLVSGDLALLHDSNGWLWRRQLRGRLTVVLIDNGGGGIFEQLPIRAEPAEALDFDRFFAMPQAPDPCALAAVHGVPARRLAAAAALPEALAWALAEPIALLVVGTDRRRDADRRRRLRTMATQASAPP